MLLRSARSALTLALLAAAVACNRSGDASARAESTSVQAGTAATASAASAQSGLVAAQTQSFDRFWAAFRQAILAGDKAAIAAVTRFPFETRGTSDDDPVKTYDRAAFPSVLDTLLAQQSDESLAGETVRQFVERTTTLPQRALGDTGDTAVVGPFSFVKTNGRWQLTRVYTSD